VAFALQPPRNDSANGSDSDNPDFHRRAFAACSLPSVVFETPVGMLSLTVDQLLTERGSRGSDPHIRAQRKRF
jgi:hypothetical protein